jgi:hypothetical protein
MGCDKKYVQLKSTTVEEYNNIILLPPSITLKTRNEHFRKMPRLHTCEVLEFLI